MNAPIFLVLNANVPDLPGDWFLAPKDSRLVKAAWSNSAARAQQFPSYQAALDAAHTLGLKSSNVFGPVTKEMMS